MAARRPRWRLATRLVPALSALALASTAGWVLLIALDGWLVTGAVRWPAGTILLWQTVINGLIHLALAGIGYAWHTAEALREARERAARADVLRARAELQLLRSQLHPHFVLNVLHALLGLVRRDPAQAESALERLGELLRFGQWVHQTGNDWVPLSREWEFVTSYLELERVRLGDRLRLRIEAEPLGARGRGAAVCPPAARRERDRPRRGAARFRRVRRRVGPEVRGPALHRGRGRRAGRFAGADR